MSRELSALIVCPSRQQVKKPLPSCFRKLCPEVRCIIVFSASQKFHVELIWQQLSGVNIDITTLSVFVAITPNGAISYVSSCYGGRTSDIFIVRNSGFLNMIEPYDELMADRGCKIREDLMMHMATLCIPPSCTSSMQLLLQGVTETSNIANVRIYVEQDIGWLKVFLLLKK